MTLTKAELTQTVVGGVGLNQREAKEKLHGADDLIKYTLYLSQGRTHIYVGHVGKLPDQRVVKALLRGSSERRQVRDG